MLLTKLSARRRLLLVARAARCVRLEHVLASDAIPCSTNGTRERLHDLAASKTLGSKQRLAYESGAKVPGVACELISIVQQRCETRAIAALLRVTTTPLADTTALQLHSRVAAHG